MTDHIYYLSAHKCDVCDCLTLGYLWTTGDTARIRCSECGTEYSHPVVIADAQSRPKPGERGNA